VDIFIDDKAVNALDWLEDEEAAFARVATIEHKKNIQIFDPYFPYAKSIFDKLGIDPDDIPRKGDY